MSPLFSLGLALIFLTAFANQTDPNSTQAIGNGRNATTGQRKTDNCTGRPPLEAQARSSTSVGKMIPVVFGPIPKGREYVTGTLDTTTVNPYSHIKEILHFIHPSPFPADLFKEFTRDTISSPTMVLKVLEMEVGFVSILFLCLFLSLVVPAMVLSLCSADPSPPPSCAPNCKRRTLVFCLQILLCFLLLGSGAMLWTNEECSRGVAKGPQFFSDFLKDSKKFFEDSTEQLQHLLTDSFDQAISPANHDLNDAENLLGRPIQVELILETGLDTALDSLVEIAAGGKEVCSQVAAILRSTLEAEQLVVTMETKLKDLREQIQMIKRHCMPLDRPLCDLIPDQLINVRFTTKMMTNSSRLVYLKQGGIDTLSASVLEANAIFTGLPIKIEKETKGARLATINEILRKKTELAASATTLDVVRTRTNIALYNLKMNTMPKLDHLLQIEYWRWLIGLVSGLLMLYVWVLITGATCCGCCGAEKSSSPTLIITLILTAMVSVTLWIISFTIMYIGGHGETCICRTMNEENYDILSKVVDTMMNIDSPTEESYMSELIHRNGTVPLPLGKILSECKADESSLKVFDLNRILDVENITNVTKWRPIHDQMNDLHIDLMYTQFFNPKLLHKLVDLQQGLLLNVTSFRTQLMGPISTDLESVISQISSISKQISDLSTSTHLDALAAKTRVILSPLIQELENKKENLVYHLTALELKINPLLHQVNQSLSHMKAVQYYISNHGSTVAQHNLKAYTDRIENYLEQYQNFVLQAIGSNKTSCREFWNIFESLKIHICRKTIDPLNGFWFSTVWCLLVIILITPICLKLIDYYNQNLGPGSELNTSESYVNSDGSDWNHESPQEDNW